MRTDVFLDEPLLDSTKDYMVSCSALAVPMSDEPMITHDVAVQDLLTVRRRRYTVQAGTAADNLDLGGTQTLSLSAANRIYCLTDFVNMVANWCAQVSNAIANAGLGPGAIVVNQVIAANHPSIDGRVNNGIQLLHQLGNVALHGFCCVLGQLLYRLQRLWAPIDGVAV